MLADLGEGVEDGEIVVAAVLVSKGQRIEPGGAGLEVETDKVVLEIPCSGGGTVAKLDVEKRDKLKIGQRILTIEA